MSFCTDCLLVNDLSECIDKITIYTNGIAGIGYLDVKSLATKRTTRYEGIIDSGGVAEFESVYLMLGSTYTFTVLDESFQALQITDGTEVYPCFQAQTYKLVYGNVEVTIGSLVSNP